MDVANIKQIQVFTVKRWNQSYTFVAGEQVLLVAGGWDMSSWSFLDSVEMLTLGNSAWEFTTPLPMAISNMGSVTLDNKVKGQICCQYKLVFRY